MKLRRRWMSDSRILLGLGVLAFCLAMPVYTSRATGAIAAREETAYGIVIDHGTRRYDYWYSYRFFANGQYFTGWNSSPNNDHAFGMTVLVYYDSQNPNENALTDFAEMSRTPFTSLVFWVDDQRQRGWLIGGGFFLFLAMVGTLTGEALGRGGMVYRKEDPKVFLWLIAIEWLGGLFLIGLYLTS